MYLYRIYGYFVYVYLCACVCVFVWVAFSQKFVYKKRNIYAIKAKLAMNAARVLLLLAQATKVAIKLLAFCKVFPFSLCSPFPGLSLPLAALQTKPSIGPSSMHCRQWREMGGVNSGLAAL